MMTLDEAIETINDARVAEGVLRGNDTDLSKRLAQLRSDIEVAWGVMRAQRPATMYCYVCDKATVWRDGVCTEHTR